VWACTCRATTIDESLRQADVVFIGKVVADWGAVGVTTFQVSGYWKGQVEKKAVLFPLSRRRSFNTCEVLFREGREYIVFAVLDKKTGELTTNICSGTREKVVAAEQIKKLGRPKVPAK